MALLRCRDIAIPLPPKWTIEPSKEPAGKETVSVAIYPFFSDFRRNVVINYEKDDPHFETVDAFARRVLDPLQGDLKDFILIHESMCNKYFPMFKRMYTFATPRADGGELRILQVQYYLLANGMFYNVTFSDIEARADELEKLSSIMASRAHIVFDEHR